MLITPAVLTLWWLSMPAYTRTIGECAAVVLRVMGYPIERVVVNAHGFLNTDTTLGFALGGAVPTAPISWVVTNIAIYISLILATRRMHWKRRVRALAIGLATLVAAHIMHVVVFFAFAPAIERNPQIPTAIAQILITLPFRPGSCWPTGTHHRQHRLTTLPENQELSPSAVPYIECITFSS